LDAAWSIFLQVLYRVTGPFLSFGSMFSLTSLACALGIAVALIALRLRRRQRRIRLRVIMRALFPRRITFHASTGIDLSYLVFNTFIFGAMFGWALFSFRAISNGTISILTSAFGTPAATALPEFATRAMLTVVLFLAYEICYWLYHYLCHRVPFLWEFHKVHHSANVLTPITAFRVHPVDTWLFANMMSVVVGAANGVANYAVGTTVYHYVLTDTNLILVVFIHVYVHFQHSHLWIAFRGLAGRILLSPAHHQVHHSANPAHFNQPSTVPTNTNQTNVQPVYDVYASVQGRDLGSVATEINKVVADMNLVTRINRGNRPEVAPAVLSLTGEGVNTNDVVTSQIDHLLLPFAGVFTGTPAEGLKQTVLLKTTKRSQLVEKFMAQFSGEQISKDFSASDKEYPLAIRLTGKFKTAFPEGKPKDTAKANDEKKDEKDKEPSADSLKASTTDGAVILVGDADMLYDQFSVQVGNFFGQKIVNLMNSNLPFLQNGVEQLSGDSNLIAVRGRATMNRPFTVVKRMQAQAEEGYRGKLKDLEKSLQETQTRLNDLQKNKESGQRFILSPEQQAEVKNFQKKEAEVKKELKKVRRDLNQDIDALETRLKWMNIAAMPLLVTISGISLALFKRKQTAAK
jgi:sterol desaturase/sphingolipid hydroxylase (fatty acid hydroxylase superfamily)